MGGDPKKMNPLQPVELVIDHSVQVDAFGTPPRCAQRGARVRAEQGALPVPAWGQKAFENFRSFRRTPGIVHQVNLDTSRAACSCNERRASRSRHPRRDRLAHDDDQRSRRARLGRRRIEAEAAMLGQPVSMLIPQVVGLSSRVSCPKERRRPTSSSRHRRSSEEGRCREVRRVFRQRPVALTLADRATIANMAPEYGATCGIFPVNERRSVPPLSGRDEAQVKLVEAYFKEQGLFHTKDTPEAVYSDTVRAQSRHGRSLPRRPDAPAGPRAPLGREEVAARRAQGDAREERAAADQWRAEAAP